MTTRQTVLLGACFPNNNLCWEGPPWLYRCGHRNQCSHQTTTDQRLKPHAMLPHQIVHGRFSSFTKLKRVLVWMLRFVRNLRTRENTWSTTLTAQELQDVEQTFFRWSQVQWFGSKSVQLSKGDSLNNSALLPLQPFMDGGGLLLRVGGRLTQSHKATSHHSSWQKDNTTHLFANHHHCLSSHAGPTLLMSLLGRDFHIIGSKQLIRSICRRSSTSKIYLPTIIICRWLAVKPDAQLMGQLPPQQVTPGPTLLELNLQLPSTCHHQNLHVRLCVLYSESHASGGCVIFDYRSIYGIPLLRMGYLELFSF